MKPLKIIDLFAGPGGLGEGFSAYRTPDGRQPFKIALSIEKERSAHRTLRLRSLFRQFADGDAPDSYYAFLRGDLGANPEDQLYRLPELKNELEAACKETLAIELGSKNSAIVYRKVAEALSGEDFILVGGPPCQAYSLVGRARNQGEKSKTYNPDEDHRNFLYKEYLQIIAKFQPAVFVMENVKGMLSARTSAGPMFPIIRSDLQDPCASTGIAPGSRGRGGPFRYRIFSFVVGADVGLFANQNYDTLSPKDFVIKAENYGIPQARHRVILLGVRDDLASSVVPDQMQQNKSSVIVRDVLHGLPRLRSGLSKEADDSATWASLPASISRLLIDAKEQIPEKVAEKLLSAVPTVASPCSRGKEFGLQTNYMAMPNHLRSWFEDPRMGGYITNHSTRGHIREDLGRYWYAANYRLLMGRSPKTTDFPKPLWPAHANFDSGKFSDRFRVQGWDAPSSTVTSHISKDGHYFIHPDPEQMRSLTVREAARLQTFPDNYHFVGSRTEQYTQVGNAVPPFLARALAEIVAKLI